MTQIASYAPNIKHDSLTIIPLGGQSELGQLLWIYMYGGQIILVDAGAAYPSTYLPGVDLLLPNTNFLEANQEKIQALLLTNGHEEHSGAVPYLLNHLKIPKILAPKFVSQLLSQSVLGVSDNPVAEFIDTIEFGKTYEVGAFEVEWLRVNNAIADASALKINTPQANVIYTSSFKIDQSPVDSNHFDYHDFATSADDNVTLLISDSTGVEYPGYTPSEASIKDSLETLVEASEGRVFIVFPGTNTHRLQLFFDIAGKTNRKVSLIGDSLLKTALSACVTGNLQYDRKIEANQERLASLPDSEAMVILSGIEDDPLNVLNRLAFGEINEVKLKEGDTLIYSGPILPGKLRFMAGILDQLLSIGVSAVHGYKQGLHVSKHASVEELKFMLTCTMPKYFLPAIGEGRHVMHHAKLAEEWGLDKENIFPLMNGEVLEIKNGMASVIGSVEAEAVLFNRMQGERVTTFSVKERKSLSHEGVVSVAVLLDRGMNLKEVPTIIVGASGFSRTESWTKTKQSIEATIAHIVTESQNAEKESSINQIRNSIREAVVKMIRGNLQAKPQVQVSVHQV